MSWQERYEGALMNTFGTPRLKLERGEGVRVWDDAGRESKTIRDTRGGGERGQSIAIGGVVDPEGVEARPLDGRSDPRDGVGTEEACESERNGSSCHDASPAFGRASAT